MACLYGGFLAFHHICSIEETHIMARHSAKIPILLLPLAEIIVL